MCDSATCRSPVAVGKRRSVMEWWPAKSESGAEQQSARRSERADGNCVVEDDGCSGASADYSRGAVRGRNSSPETDLGTTDEQRPDRDSGQVCREHDRGHPGTVVMPGRHGQREMPDRLPDSQQHHHLGNPETMPPRTDNHADNRAPGDQQTNRRLTRGDNTTTDGMRRNTHRSGRGTDERTTQPRRSLHRCSHRAILLPVVGPDSTGGSSRPPPRLAHSPLARDMVASLLARSRRRVSFAGGGGIEVSHMVVDGDQLATI